MSANSDLNRYNPVPRLPPIPAKQPPGKRNMSTSRTEKREPSQSSNLHAYGNTGLVSNATIKRQASRTTAAAGTEKPVSVARTKAHTKADAQCNGKTEKEVTSATDGDERALVRSLEETAVRIEEKEASSAVHESDAENAASAAADDDDDEDEDDDGHSDDDDMSSTSVSFISLDY